MAVADDCRSHAVEGSNLLRSALSVTASHNDLRFRIQPPCLANKSASIAIGFGSHAAGIHDHHGSIGQSRLRLALRSVGDC
jgi:hypothetical protein